jgi:Fur family ferric uptake transcriptional regulator
MSCEAETMRLLRERGHKLTPQRMMVLSVIRHAAGHMRAAEIYERVRESYPYVDISTVYRTMSVLKELRLVTETDLGTGESTFEWAGSAPHHHLICRACGGIESLDHQLLARLGADLLRDRGFRADLDHFAIFGLCSVCRQAEETAEHAASASRSPDA